MTRRGRGRPPHPDILTPAEWRVLEHLRTGATYAETAVRLGVSPDAVRFHVRNMRAKLNLRDRAELVAWTPPDHDRRRSFRALMAPLGALPFATRAIASVAAVPVVTGAIVFAVVMVVTTRGDGEAAPIAVVPTEVSVTATPMATPTPTLPPTPIATPEATPTVVATTVATPSPAPAVATETQAPGPEPTATPPAVEIPDLRVSATDCESRPLGDQAFFGSLYTTHVGSPGPVYLWDELRWADPRGVFPELTVVAGTVVEAERTEVWVRDPEYPELYSHGKLHLTVLVEEQLPDRGDIGSTVRVTLTAETDYSWGTYIDWSLLDVEGSSPLCNRVLFAGPGDAGEYSTWAGNLVVEKEGGGFVIPSEYPEFSYGDNISDFEHLVRAFRLFHGNVNPISCPLFGTDSPLAELDSWGQYLPVWSTEDGSQVPLDVPIRDSADEFVTPGEIMAPVELIISGNIVRIDKQSKLERLGHHYAIFDVSVQSVLKGGAEPGALLRVLLLTAGDASLADLEALLPCRNAILLLSDITKSVREDYPELANTGRLYGLVYDGLFVEAGKGTFRGLGERRAVIARDHSLRDALGLHSTSLFSDFTALLRAAADEKGVGGQ